MEPAVAPRTIVAILLAGLAAAGSAFAGAPADAAAGSVPALAVDLRNDGVEAVSVPAGSDNGVGGESDFVVVVSDNLSVVIYAAELFHDRFWSQPLRTDDYRQIRLGMPVRPASLSTVEHAVVRSEGKARLAEIRAKQEEARREAARQKADDLRVRRETLVEERDLVEDKIASAERDLADEEGRMEWATSSTDEDIDRASQRIADLADRRDELQSQRSAASQQSSARRDVARLTSEIGIINGQIATERERIRLTRDKRRQARATYVARREEWQKLVVRRNALVGEIRSLDLRIRELLER